MQEYRQTEKLDFEKVWIMFQETKEQLKESRELITQVSLDTDKKFKATDKKLNKLEHLFTSQWGKLIESLVKGDLVRLLNEKGIKVNQTSTRIEGKFNNRQYEFDIIAENGEEIVVVEVKTTLKPEYVYDFLEELEQFKLAMPKYKLNKVIGAVAFLTDDSEASIMAQKKGLFAIRATGNSASIINNETFIPRVW